MPRWPAGPMIRCSHLRPDVLEVDRRALDAPGGRRDVVGELPGLVDRRVHDRHQEGLVGRAGQPLAAATGPLLIREAASVRIEMRLPELADAAVELPVRQPQTVGNAVALEDLVPARDARRAVL